VYSHLHAYTFLHACIFLYAYIFLHTYVFAGIYIFAFIHIFARVVCLHAYCCMYVHSYEQTRQATIMYIHVNRHHIQTNMYPCKYTHIHSMYCCTFTWDPCLCECHRSYFSRQGICVPTSMHIYFCMCILCTCILLIAGIPELKKRGPMSLRVSLVVLLSASYFCSHLHSCVVCVHAFCLLLGGGGPYLPPPPFFFLHFFLPFFLRT